MLVLKKSNKIPENTPQRHQLTVKQVPRGFRMMTPTQVKQARLKVTKVWHKSITLEKNNKPQEAQSTRVG